MQIICAVTRSDIHTYILHIALIINYNSTYSLTVKCIPRLTNLSSSLSVSLFSFVSFILYICIYEKEANTNIGKMNFALHLVLIEPQKIFLKDAQADSTKRNEAIQRVK